MGEERTLQGLPQGPHSLTVAPLLPLHQSAMQPLQSSQYLLTLSWEDRKELRTSTPPS